MRTRVAPAVALLVLSSFLAIDARGQIDPEQERKLARAKLDATLWVQESIEYQLLCTQAFSTASDRLCQALRDRSAAALPSDLSAPPAVILDIDETVLSNALSQARGVVDGKLHRNDRWTAWVAERKATPLAGAGDFLALARANRVSIFFVTNRKAVEEADTVANLTQAFGIPVHESMVLCNEERPEWTSDKTSRRNYVARSYRVLLLVGDDVNDFVLVPTDPTAASVAQAQALRHAGRNWIVLPNPMYGSWERRFRDTARENIDARRALLETGRVETAEPAMPLPAN